MEGALDVALQRCGEVAVALGRHDGQYVDRVPLLLSEGREALPLSGRVHAQAKAAPDLLALSGLAIRVLQRAALEDVRVVLALAQGGVAEDEPRGLFEGKQSLLVSQDEVVCALVAAALEFGVDAAPLLVDGEVALVRIVCGDAGKVLAVEFVQRQAIHELCHASVVLLLKYLPIRAVGGLAVLVVESVLGDFVDEEEAQALDVARVERLLLQVVLPGFVPSPVVVSPWSNGMYS